MAAKNWESDFRYAAIRASIEKLSSQPEVELFDTPGSVCVPIAKKPVVGLTPGKVMVVCLVLGFVFLGGAVFLTGSAERNKNRGRPAAAWIVPVGSVMGVTGISLFFAPVVFDRWIVRFVVGSRASELVRRRGKLLCAEISDTDRSKMTVSIDGDDYVLLLADQDHRRLLIEGIAARYMIRSSDVTDLQPFQYLNYVGAELTYRIDDQTTLSLAIARVSMLLELTRQVPVLFFLRRLIRNRILRTCEEVLGPIPSVAGR
jgi:hypothetical protein